MPVLMFEQFKFQSWKCEERLSEKSTVHIADGKNLQNSSKIHFHHLPFFPSPPHFTPSPPPSCSLFQKRQPPPRQGAATHRRGASHPQLGASLPLSTSLSLSSSHKTQFTPTHPLTLASGSRSMQNARNKARGWWGGRPWQFLNTTCSTLLQPTLRNRPADTAALSGHTLRHVLTIDRINDDRKLSCTKILACIWYFSLRWHMASCDSSDWVFHRVKNLTWLTSCFICAAIVTGECEGLLSGVDIIQSRNLTWRLMWTARMHLVRHSS